VPVFVECHLSSDGTTRRRMPKVHLRLPKSTHNFAYPSRRHTEGIVPSFFVT
jgi:hypothetical protein